MKMPMCVLDNRASGSHTSTIIPLSKFLHRIAAVIHRRGILS
jgi:hypothetical protein